LFNRLAGRKISIVHDQPGVTRDRITALCKRGSAPFEIVDTGGIGTDPDPDFAAPTREAADVAIAGADALVLVVDAQDGLTPLDTELARQLRKSGRPLVLAINKVDNEKIHGDFDRLGIESAVSVSAAHGLGIIDLVEEIELALPPPEDVESEAHIPRLAVVGRPNVGKSSLTNALLGEERTIVSDIAGTTRDSVDTRCSWGDTSYILCDTAGIRHRSRHNTSVEVFSVMRAEDTLRRADLCLLVIDAQQGVTAQDKKIAGLIQKEGKACVIVLNKWDLFAGTPGIPSTLSPPSESVNTGRTVNSVNSGSASKKGKDKETSRELLDTHIEKLRGDLFFLPYAPVVVLSAKTGMNLRRLFNILEKVAQHARRRIGTGELNRVLRGIMERQPPPSKSGRRFKFFYATQVIPSKPGHFEPITILLFANDTRILPDNYRNFLIGRLREHWEFPGLPFNIRLRSRNEGVDND